MKILDVLQEVRTYTGASGITMLNVYDNKLPKKKKMPRLKKGVHGVDAGDSGGE